MFSKTITNSGKFLKMPATSRLLYYDLGMNADDDVFAESFMVMRISGASEQDLKVLEANGLVQVFDENVLIILNWPENNYIQKDRYTPSKYKDVYKMDTECIQNGSTGKGRLGKDRKGKSNILPTAEAVGEENGAIINSLIGEFQPINPSYTRLYKNKTQREAVGRLMKQHGTEPLRGIIQFLQKTNGKRFAPTITTPLQLEERMGTLIAFCEKVKDNSLVAKPAKEIIGL